MERLMSLVGMVALLGIAWLMSNNKRRINWQTVAVGIGLQLLLGIILLWVPFTASAFGKLTSLVGDFLALSEEGAAFVFGPLADIPRSGFVFAIHVSATITFFSAFISIMYHLGVVQVIINGIATVMRITMRTSGAETLSCSANIFVGQTEAPLMIKPFADKMTMSELHAVMVGGFATIAGGVLAAYAGMGVPINHLIIASVMSAPAALVMAKMVIPETEESQTAGNARLPSIKVGENVVDAAARGTTDGLYLALNVLAMLIAFIALLALANWVLGYVDYWIDGRLLGGTAYAVEGLGVRYDGIVPGSLSRIFGFVFGPLAFLMGVPPADVMAVGDLLGIKICANEFVAYGKLTTLIADGELSPRSIIIATYALCGFANFGSVGIQIGGISAIAPNRRSDLARLALKAMVAGALASWMTACVAGLFAPYDLPLPESLPVPGIEP